MYPHAIMAIIVAFAVGATGPVAFANALEAYSQLYRCSRFERYSVFKILNYVSAWIESSADEDTPCYPQCQGRRHAPTAKCQRLSG